jgi:hypothetical protein
MAKSFDLSARHSHSRPFFRGPQTHRNRSDFYRRGPPAQLNQSDSTMTMDLECQFAVIPGFTLYRS